MAEDNMIPLDNREKMPILEGMTFQERLGILEGKSDQDRLSSLICSHCMEEFSGKEDLKDHYQRLHKVSPEKLQPCVETQGTKRVVRKMARHLCTLCSKHFGDFWTLRHHLRTVHQDSRDHRCPVCGKSFLSNKDMMRHQRGVHMGHKITFPGGRPGIPQPDLGSEDNLDSSTVVHSQQTEPLFTIRKRQQLSYGNNIVMVDDYSASLQGVHSVQKGGSGHRSNRCVSETKSLPNILKKCENSKYFPAQNRNSLVIQEKISSEVKSNSDKVWGEGKRGLAEMVTVKVDDKVKLSTTAPMPEEAPIFQLENLENLQFVLPEGSGEPQIIIPETGIRLTIPETGGSGDKQVLHLVPEKVEHFSELGNMDFGNVLHTENEITEDAETIDQPVITTEDPLDRLVKSPDKFIYKKVCSDASSQLVAVQEIFKDKSIKSVEKFKCEICSKFYINKDFLEKHISLNHPVHNIFQEYDSVISMKQKTDSMMEMEQDINSLINTKDNIDNVIADKQLDSRTILKQSIVDSISAEDNICNISCKTCGIYFESKALLAKHKKLLHKKCQSFRCNDCGNEFTSKQTLKSHISSVHEGIKKVCSHCLKPVADLVRHIRTQHRNKDIRQFSCESCPMEFRTNFSLQRHWETVHLKLKSWLCDLCEKSFGEKRDMIRHKNAVHFGIKNKQSRWICPECDLVFKLRREYDEHKTNQHTNLTEEQVVKFLNAELETKKSNLQINNFKSQAANVCTKHV